MKEFKIGQRVRIINSEAAHNYSLHTVGLVGTEFTVEEVMGWKSTDGGSVTKNDEGWYIPSEACELVEDAASPNTIKVKKLHPDAVIPQYATDGAGCFDLVATDDGVPHPTDENAIIFGIGLAFEIQPEWVMEIDSRSGQGFKEAIRLSNGSGQIDSDYRGEVKVSLRFDGQGERKVYKKGDRIAQAKLVPAPRFKFVEVEELSETERGSGGFGSTGK